MPWIWQTGSWPKFFYDAALVANDLATATEAMGEIAGMQQGLSAAEREDFRLRHLVQEALGSFGIEGVALNPDQIEASVIASLRHRDRTAFSRRSDAIAALMLHAQDNTVQLTGALLCDWHRMLFFGMEVEDLGRWRSTDIEIVRSAAAGKHEVLFAAPPPNRLSAEMSAFLDWLDREHTLPVPVRAAIAHLWFETIHPFSDGNGRIGRALIEHIFARARPLPFSLSRQIETEKRDYYAALQAGRQERDGTVDATPFVQWFLQCLARAASAARAEAQFLLSRNHYLARFAEVLGPRQQEVLAKLFAQGPTRIAEGISARSYARIAGVSGPTATRDLAALAASGALVRSDAGGRSTVYHLAMES